MPRTRLALFQATCYRSCQFCPVASVRGRPVRAGRSAGHLQEATSAVSPASSSAHAPIGQITIRTDWHILLMIAYSYVSFPRFNNHKLGRSQAQRFFLKQPFSTMFVDSIRHWCGLCRYHYEPGDELVVCQFPLLSIMRRSANIPSEPVRSPHQEVQVSRQAHDTAPRPTWGR